MPKASSFPDTTRVVHIQPSNRVAADPLAATHSPDKRQSVNAVGVMTSYPAWPNDLVLRNERDATTKHHLCDLVP